MKPITRAALDARIAWLDATIVRMRDVAATTDSPMLPNAEAIINNLVSQQWLALAEYRDLMKKETAMD
jgi:hypothetical protein